MPEFRQKTERRRPNQPVRRRRLNAIATGVAESERRRESNMTTYRALWTALVLATLVLPSARAASAQTSNAPPAQAQDGPSAERKGFILGIGAGGALHRLPERGVTGDTLDRSAFAFGTDFKIGYAPTDQLLIYYSAKAGFTQAADYDAVGVSGFGVTYMTRPTAPSFFVSGIAGEGGRATLDLRDWRDGRGFAVGAGYEFKRHWSISGDALFLRFGGNDNHAVVLATVGYLFY
jgi:hypothetical protein